MPEPDMLPELAPLPEVEPDVEPPRDRVDVLVSVPTALWSPGMLLEPESILPVEVPPRSLLCELQPANANTPANSGITKILLFIVTSSVHCRR